MAKKMESGKGDKFMNNGVGLCSYKKNPMKMARQVAPECGPGGNPDQQKANRLLQAAHREEDSLRGEMGM